MCPNIDLAQKTKTKNKKCSKEKMKFYTNLPFGQDIKFREHFWLKLLATNKIIEFEQL